MTRQRLDRSTNTHFKHAFRVTTSAGDTCTRAPRMPIFVQASPALVRRGDRGFLVDTWHQYAEIEVPTDKLSAEQIFWYRSLSGREREKMTMVTWETGLLSF
ncbi:MAG: hypothetical protein NVSMB38_30540 [Ktedonobacteraceae bacterium]